MTIVIIQRITAMMPMPVCASLGRTGDRERGHRKGRYRSQDYDCLLHHRFSKSGTEPSERYRPAPQFQAAIIPLAFGTVWTLPVGDPAAKPSLGGLSPDVLLLEADLQGAGLAKKAASLLTKREIFPQFECAQTIFLDFGRRPDQRKRRVRKLLPDSNIFRRNREPPEPEHVSARFGYSPDLSPCDLLDGRRAWTVRDPARAHFEGVKLQSERRQRQLQIIQFFGARVVPVVAGGCRLRFAAGNIHDGTRHAPAGLNRRGYPDDHFNQLK